MFVIDKIDQLDQPVGPQVDASLQRLGLDHVDAFVFHGAPDFAALRFDELDACVKAGKVRFRGISSHNPVAVHQAILSGLCDVVMFPVGPYCDARYIEDCLPLARERSVGTVCFKTFGAGKLLGDTEGYNRPLQQRPRGKVSSGGGTTTPLLPHLPVAECLHYTLTCNPDVALLGLSFPNEQDAALAAYQRFQPLTPASMADIRARAQTAMAGKGACWWNPPA